MLKLRAYVEENFDGILQKVEEEIQKEGWIPSDNEDFEADATDQPCLVHGNVPYMRPWGDFVLILADIAQNWYQVREKTAISYAKAALRALERKLSAKKWRRPTNGTTLSPPDYVAGRIS
jgi:hypothetical protein